MDRAARGDRPPLAGAISRDAAVTRRRRILLVNPNTSELITEILAREARRIVGDEAEIVAVTAPFGSVALECRAELVIAAHAVLEAIAAQSDYDAAVIGAFGDPGLEAAQDIATAPVFGLGRSGLAAASAGGRRFAIVTIGERMRAEVERVVAACGLASQLAAIRFLNAGVLDVARDRDSLRDAMMAAARDCVRHGAEAILFGGAPFAGVGFDVADRIAVPVFDGLTSAMRQAMVATANAATLIGAPRPTAGNACLGLSEPLTARIQDFLRSRI
jgi:Asp/Glu/hydantoin racemase